MRGFRTATTDELLKRGSRHVRSDRDFILPQPEPVVNPDDFDAFWVPEFGALRTPPVFPLDINGLEGSCAEFGALCREGVAGASRRNPLISPIMPGASVVPVVSLSIFLRIWVTRVLGA